MLTALAFPESGVEIYVLRASAAAHALIAMFGWVQPAQRRAMGKTVTKESMKRVPFNWPKLKKMWDEGKSYVEMAKALDSHYDPEGDDPTKATRARCSIAMTKGIQLDGKLVRFKRRSKPNTEKESKPKSTATKKPTTKAKVQKPKVTAKKPAKVVPLTPSQDKTTQPTEA